MVNCDICHKPAIFHPAEIKAGKRTDVHLCERCARIVGIRAKGQVPISERLRKFVMEQTGRSQLEGGSSGPPGQRD